MKKIIFLLLLSINLFGAETTLKTDLQDVPPKFFMKGNNKISGISYDIMKLVEKYSKYKFVFEKELIPISRVTHNLELGLSDIQFGLQKTADREKKYVYGEELYKIKIIGLMKRTNPIMIKSIKDLVKNSKNIRILTQYGTAVDSSLKKISGLNIDSGSKSLENSLEKLKLDRGEIVIYHDLSIKYLMSLDKNQDDYKVIEIDFGSYDELGDVGQFVVFSKKVPQNVRNEINDIVKKLKTSGEIQKIATKYNGK